MNDTKTVLVVTSVADIARTRVKDALKTTVENEVLASEPAIVGHSAHDHKSNPTVSGEEDDRALAGVLWGVDGEEAIVEFAKRLTALESR